jgi:pilus assembly protein CpaB
MGRWRALGPIVLALVIAGVGSYFIYSWMQQQARVSNGKPAPEKAEKTESIKVVVANVNMVPGTKITSEMVRTEDYLKHSAPPDHFADSASLVGRITIDPLKSGEPIIESRLASIDIKTGGVSALIAEGKRAVAIGGDKVLGLSGFVYPGNRVDVLVTWADVETEEEITKTILENVLVLATGTLMQKNEKGDAAPVDVYTLELTPEESEILTIARNQGKIQLALRSPVDGGTVITQGATHDKAMNYLLSKLNLPPKPKASLTPAEPLVPVRIYRPAPAKPKITVEIVSNGQLTKQTF